jgi:hypothetical protein
MKVRLFCFYQIAELLVHRPFPSRTGIHHTQCLQLLIGCIEQQSAGIASHRQVIDMLLAILHSMNTIPVALPAVQRGSDDSSKRRFRRRRRAGTHHTIASSLRMAAMLK